MINEPVMLNKALEALGIDGGWKIKNGKIAKWYADQPQPSEEQIQAKIAELEAAEPIRILRLERNRRLAETDWIITKGLEQGTELTEWITYRQALRDLPATADLQLDNDDNLTNVTWPEVPE